MSSKVNSLAYYATPLPHYKAQITQPYGFALTGGRYTIIGWDPTHVVDKNDQAFETIQSLTPKINSPISPCGGWYGYLGYELAEQLHGKLSPRKRDLPLPDLSMGLYDRVVVFDHQKREAYEVIHPSLRGGFTRRSNPVKSLDCFAPIGLAMTKFVSNPTSSYQTAFNQIQSALRRGDCYQVNLAQRFTSDFTGNPWDYFLNLMQVNPAPFAAYYQLPNAAIISCSPERFIRIDNGYIQTKPIKGTCARHQDSALDQAAAQALQKSEKNKAENLMIVDLMRHDFGKICLPGSVSVPDLFRLETYRSVHHLVSTVEGRLKPEVSSWEALKACFPGGSITGAPKLAAMQQIQALEPHARHVYCGCIGYADFSGIMDMNIAIRTAVITQGQCHVWAGGGIVLDSVCEEEYQECFDKISLFGIIRSLI